MHSPTPPLVKEGKARIDRGERLQESFEKRLFYCRSCGTRRTGVVVPQGWYALARHTGVPQEKPQRLGIYCSLECLSEQLPRLSGVEEQLGQKWVEETAKYRQKPTR